jgi:hypothetical protein
MNATEWEIDRVSARNITKRLQKLEQKLRADDGTFTLEELCRSMWHEDPRRFREIANGTMLGYFTNMFEGEDARSRRAVSTGPEPK